MRKPTDKQKLAYSIKKENPKMAIGEVLIKAGYSKNTAKNPSRDVLDSPGVKSLQEEYQFYLRKKNVTPKRLATKLNEGLEVEDHRIRLEYIDRSLDGLGLKEQGTNVNTQINIAAPNWLKKSDAI